MLWSIKLNLKKKKKKRALQEVQHYHIEGPNMMHEQCAQGASLLQVLSYCRPG